MRSLGRQPLIAVHIRQELQNLDWQRVRQHADGDGDSDVGGATDLEYNVVAVRERGEGGAAEAAGCHSTAQIGARSDPRAPKLKKPDIGPVMHRNICHSCLVLCI